MIVGLINKVFTLMLNHPRQSVDPIQEDMLQVFGSDVVEN
jgi:hypothetical protein